MGVFARYLAAAGAIVCLAAVTASAGFVSARHSTSTYSTHGTLPLRTSLDDPFTFTGPERAMGFQKARAAGASYVRMIASWDSIAPGTPPAGFDAADPTSPGYSWGWLDSTVEAAKDAGVTPILDIARAPGRALAASHGKRVFTPKISALQQFAKAIA